MAYEMITLSAEEHDNFVKNHKYGELNQIYKWQYVKKGWIGKNIGVKKDDKLIGACLILLKNPISYLLLIQISIINLIFLLLILC